MRSKILLFGLFFIILSLNTISAEIMLSQPKSIYNLGDVLAIEATIKPSQYISTFFEMNLVCGEESKNMHREHLTLEVGKEKKVSSSLSLTKSFLGNVLGDCNIKVNFGGDIGETQSFKISDVIDVTLSIENMSIEVGKEVELKGNALKKNGKQVEGFVEVTVENTDIKIIRTVSGGNFAASFSFPAGIRAGNYIVTSRVYEKAQGEETNSGEAKVTLNIKKKPSKVEIAISKQSINPGEEIIFKPIIYDQANEEVGGETSVRIYDAFDNVFFQKILKSGEEKNLFLETNSSPGYWRIEAKALDLEAKRLFYVEELEKASFMIENDTLTITNIGNVVYRKSIQISIGEITEIKTIDLDVGRSMKLRLLAPEGKYSIRVTDGVDEVVVSEVSLTGKVVDIREVGKGFSFTGRYPIIWLFLIAVFGLFILVLVQRVAKRKFYAKGSYEKPAKEMKLGKEKRKATGKELQVPIPSLPEKAEHSLVLHGRKEKSSIISVKLKDIDKVRKSSSETINNIIREIIDNKGVVYEVPDYIIGIFSSTTTKTFKNEILTVKVSKRINEILNEHNKKFREKIDYGVSVNTGELVFKREPHKLRFTALGGSINLAKRIASLANREVLLGEDIQKLLGSEIRTEKESRQGVNVYHIKSIIDREKNKAFISGFLRRLGEEQKQKKMN